MNLADRIQHPIPNIWQISKPYFNWGRAVYPQIFSPSGITERGYTLKITIFTNFATEKSCSMFLENCKKNSGLYFRNWFLDLVSKLEQTITVMSLSVTKVI